LKFKKSLAILLRNLQFAFFNLQFAISLFLRRAFAAFAGLVVEDAAFSLGESSL